MWGESKVPKAHGSSKYVTLFCISTTLQIDSDRQKFNLEKNYNIRVLIIIQFVLFHSFDSVNRIQNRNTMIWYMTFYDNVFLDLFIWEIVVLF